jgi:hypothetical protein
VLARDILDKRQVAEFTVCSCAGLCRVLSISNTLSDRQVQMSFKLLG